MYKQLRDYSAYRKYDAFIGCTVDNITGVAAIILADKGLHVETLQLRDAKPRPRSTKRIK